MMIDDCTKMEDANYEIHKNLRLTAISNRTNKRLSSRNAATRRFIERVLDATTDDELDSSLVLAGLAQLQRLFEEMQADAFDVFFDFGGRSKLELERNEG